MEYQHIDVPVAPARDGRANPASPSTARNDIASARERSAAKTSSMPRSVDSVASTTGPVRGREGLNTQRVMRAQYAYDQDHDDQSRDIGGHGSMLDHRQANRHHRNLVRRPEMRSRPQYLPGSNQPWHGESLPRRWPVPYPNDASRDRPWVMRTYAGHSSPAAVQCSVPAQLGQGPDRFVRCLRSTHADWLRPRRGVGAGRGRQGRRTDCPHRRYAGPVRRHPVAAHEHVHDDQCSGDVVAGPLFDGGRGAGRGHRAAGRYHPERHHQGVPLAGNLRVPARAIAPADHRHDHLHGAPRAPVESDQRVQLSPAGGRSDPGAGSGIRAGHGDRSARRSP